MTLMVFLKEYFKKVVFEKKQMTKKNMENNPACRELYRDSSFEYLQHVFSLRNKNII